MEQTYCSICLDGFNTGLVQCRNDATGQSACRQCLEYYAKSLISDAFKGTCPILYCPLCIGNKTNHRCILPYNSSVTSLVDSSVTNRYEELARNLLSIQCSVCHRRGTLLVPYNALQKDENLNALQNLLGDGLAEFMGEVEMFEEGLLTVSEFNDRLISYYIANITSETDDIAWKTFARVLSVIVNPERRASLHLRYIRSRPRVWSQCCQAQMCFKCKTRDYHNGKTCEELSSSLCNEMLPCFQCGLQLVKGDGCNHVTCLCGNSFGWAEELRRIGDVQAFANGYPVHTALHCARILCDATGNESLRKQAQSWKHWNSEAYHRGVLSWWLEAGG
jgi:hypothetical protein